MTDYYITREKPYYTGQPTDLKLLREQIIYQYPYVEGGCEWPEREFATTDYLSTPEGLGKLYKAIYDHVQTSETLKAKVGDSILLPDGRVFVTFPNYSFHPEPESWVRAEWKKLDATNRDVKE